MNAPLPFAAPMRRFRRYGAEVEAALSRVLAGEGAILGAEVAAFEAAFAQACAARHAVGVASGTDALKLALQACGVGAGDEVLVPALTAPATAQAVLLAGACPVYVDVQRDRRAMDPTAAAAAIGPRTAAILVVHLYGVPADIEALRDLATRKGLVLIEDCAQAHGCTVAGRSVGTFGDAAAFSFYPTKNLGCIGDGGRSSRTTTPSPIACAPCGTMAGRPRPAFQRRWRGPAGLTRFRRRFFWNSCRI